MTLDTSFASVVIKVTAAGDVSGAPKRGVLVGATLVSGDGASSDVTLKEGGSTGAVIGKLKAPTAETDHLNTDVYYKDTLYANITGDGAELYVYLK